MDDEVRAGGSRKSVKTERRRIKGRGEKTGKADCVVLLPKLYFNFLFFSELASVLVSGIRYVPVVSWIKNPNTCMK